MKIGYAVQGATDRAFLRGLGQRWCPDAELVEGAFRGSTGLALRRELAKICEDLLHHKQCSAVIILSDSDSQNWRDVHRSEVAKLPQERKALVVYGIADRNIECWLCADSAYVATKADCTVDSLKVDDPKTVFERAMGVSRDDRKEDSIIALVVEAPVDVLKTWYATSESFEHFYKQLRAVGTQLKCAGIENLQ